SRRRKEAHARTPTEWIVCRRDRGGGGGLRRWRDHRPPRRRDARRGRRAAATRIGDLVGVGVEPAERRARRHDQWHRDVQKYESGCDYGEQYRYRGAAAELRSRRRALR